MLPVDLSVSRHLLFRYFLFFLSFFIPPPPPCFVVSRVEFDRPGERSPE